MWLRYEKEAMFRYFCLKSKKKKQTPLDLEYMYKA